MSICNSTITTNKKLKLPKKIQVHAYKVTSSGLDRPREAGDATLSTKGQHDSANGRRYDDRNRYVGGTETLENSNAYLLHGISDTC